MSSVIQSAADMVRAFRGGASAILDHDLDERDMTKEQLADFAIAFGKVAEIASSRQSDLEAQAKASFH